MYSVPSVVDPEPMTCIIEPGMSMLHIYTLVDNNGGLYLGGFIAANNVDMLK